jgi:L-alanine-DL-glutamate epimerase-like enolase superfamily enzyme
MGRLTLQVATETLQFAEPFRISGYVFETVDVVVVTLGDGENSGRGEASGVYYLGDDIPHVVAELENARGAIEAEPNRDELREILPPGGARNAVDCALWELESARAERPIWELAGLPAPKPILTTFTVGADSPESMARKAAAYSQARSLKIKLTGDLDLDIERVHAIRKARPDAWLGVDGNQGFVIDQLDRLVAALHEEGVSLVEQPLARGREADLEGYRSLIPIAGDESLVSLDDVAGALGRFDVVNIKLDKCGGLTEALLMVTEARRLGLGVMVGTMVGSSLATAPGFLLGQICDLVDLDGSTFLATDPRPGALYQNGELWVASEVWGAAGVLAQ